MAKLNVANAKSHAVHFLSHIKDTDKKRMFKCSSSVWSHSTAVVTSDRSKVTCKNCLNSIARTPKQPVQHEKLNALFEKQY